MKKLKVWVYYLVINSDKQNILDFPAVTDDLCEQEGKYIYGLYGYTNDKNIAKEFEQTRDMSLFKVVKYTDPKMAKDIWIELNDMEPDYLIDYNNFNTQSYNDQGNTCSRDISILSTTREFEFVMEESDFLLESSIAQFIDFIKNTDKLLSMETLSRWLSEFKNIFKDEIKESLDAIEMSQIILDYLVPDDTTNASFFYETDTLSIFCNIFSNTFRKE